MIARPAVCHRKAIELVGCARWRNGVATSGIALGVIAGLVLLGSLSCSTPPEQMSLTELTKEYSSTLRKLGSLREEERTEAINRFLAAGRERGSEVVVYFLEDRAVIDDERLRANLAGLLALWKDPRGIPYLLEHIRSRDLGILRIVEEGLIEYGDNPRVIELVGAFIDDSSVRTRRLVASVLSKISDRRVLPYLGGRLRDPDEEVRALCLLGIEQAPESLLRTEYLIDALTDPDIEIRRIAWSVLKNGENSPPISFDPNGKERERASSVAQLRQWAGIPRTRNR